MLTNSSSIWNSKSYFNVFHKIWSSIPFSIYCFKQSFMYSRFFSMMKNRFLTFWKNLRNLIPNSTICWDWRLGNLLWNWLDDLSWNWFDDLLWNDDLSNWLVDSMIYCEMMICQIDSLIYESMVDFGLMIDFENLKNVNPS